MKNLKASGSFQEIFNVWPSFADIMMRLPLLFVSVVTLFMVTETTPSRALSTEDRESQRLQTDMFASNQELQRLRSEIRRPEQLVQGQMEAEAKLKAELRSQEAALELAVKEIQDRTEQLWAKDDQLSALRKELETALEEIKEKTGLLQEREQRLSDLGLKLTQTEQDLAKAKGELSDKEKSLLDLRARLNAFYYEVASLKDKMAGYVDEAGRLNRLLSESKESEAKEKTKAASLHEEISALQSKLTEISGKQASMEGDAETNFRLSQSVDLLTQKDQEIDKLRKLAGYRGEFLAKLEEAFAGVPNIKVQGDRVVFQSEIMFAPGKAEINELGKRELDRFSSVYKEIIPKIPEGNDPMILVQGHTDIDPVKSKKYRSNWELSADRAKQVVLYLIEKGIPATRLGATALAEFHPVAEGDSPEAKRLNRRIEIKITSL